MTTNGAFYGGFVGLLSAIILVILGPTIWVEILGFKEAIFPYKYPALFSVSIAFFSIILISILDKDNLKKDNEENFNLMVKKSYIGK